MGWTETRKESLKSEDSAVERLWLNTSNCGPQRSHRNFIHDKLGADEESRTQLPEVSYVKFRLRLTLQA